MKYFETNKHIRVVGSSFKPDGPDGKLQMKRFTAFNIYYRLSQTPGVPYQPSPPVNYGSEHCNKIIDNERFMASFLSK